MRISTAVLLGIGALGFGAVVACSSNTTQSVMGSDSATPMPAATGSDNQAFKSGKEPTLDELTAAFKHVPTAAGPVPVVWRLDDVQAWYCSSILDDILAPFTSTNTPLSVGIIGTGLSDDSTVVSVLQGLKGNPNIQFANHSFTHPSGGMPSLGGEAAQQNDLQQAQTAIEGVTGVTPDTFIPPENLYNTDTQTAMANVGLVDMSAQCTWTGPGAVDNCAEGSGVVWPKLSWENIAMMPAGAVIDSWTDFTQPASVTTAQAWANAQIANQGFAVFMLHPQEFATDASTCKQPDTTKIGVLQQVISQGKAAGWKYYTFDGMAKAAASAARKQAAR